MLPACASSTIVAAMSEESVMKQALSPEVPARVRRGQFRAITLGIGASALAMACSFGEIDGEQGGITPIPTDGNGEKPTVTGEDPPETVTGNGTATNNGPDQSPSATPDEEERPFDPNDPFSTDIGQQVADILRVNCGGCHIGQGAKGDFGYL